MLQQHSLRPGEPFLTESGKVLTDLQIVYYTSPRAYSPEEKVIWICHALTANANPEDWWPEMVGPGKFLDPDRYFIVCVNALCSPYGSTCPACVNPETGKPYLLDFPKITIRDVARTNVMVRKHLGIRGIDLLVGSSSGGFQAWEIAVIDSDAVRSAVFMATAPKMPAFLAATNESQRMAIEADPSYFEATDPSGGRKGMECARSIALLSYRSPECYQTTQAEKDPEFLFASRAASYQRHQGEKLAARGFDAYSYRRLCDLIDSQNIGRGRGGLSAALSLIKARVCIVAIRSDLIFPPLVVSEPLQFMPTAEYEEIDSLYGHDGFLLETAKISSILSRFV